MAGTLAGGKHAAATNKKLYGENYYHRIGALGGKAGNTGGFAVKTLCTCEYNLEGHKRAECAGSKGGRISRRGSRADYSQN